jgi:hypothetical protein
VEVHRRLKHENDSGRFFAQFFQGRNWPGFRPEENDMGTLELVILIVVLVVLFGGGGGYYYSRRGR